MSFIITKNPKFTAEVEVETPNDKGGFDKSKFKVTFKRPSMDEIKSKDDLKKQIIALEDSKTSDLGITEDDEKKLDELKNKYKSMKNGLRDMTQEEVLKSVILDWSDLFDEDKNIVEYSENNLTALLNIPQAQLALTEAFWSSIFKAKTKN